MSATNAQGFSPCGPATVENDDDITPVLGMLLDSSMLQDVIATLITETDRNVSDKDIDYLINYALYEILNPQKDYVDDRPCDTEAPEQTTDNVIKVNFK